MISDRGDELIEHDEERDLGPGEADFDLSEDHPYSWEPKPALWRVSPTVLAVVSVIIVVALVLPSVLIVWQFR